ncbi:MAG: hypothetical protein EAY81_08270 [Bacteroidetes bacterium]|nr:MAG: hypothetical protein EAY81_08270 [Bacteroidota bacterium]
MLRNKQYIHQLLIIYLLGFTTQVLFAHETDHQPDSLVFQYKIGVNGTLDKSLVTRLIFNTQNSFVIRNRWLSVEPTLSYRYGYVEPNNRPKTNLENDVFVMLKSHFWYQGKLFPSVLVGYENSPNIRRLNHRLQTGLGVGSHLLKSRNQVLQVMLYGLYEQSDFEALHYDIFRLMPFIKGNHFFKQYHVGVAYTIQPFLSTNPKNNQRYRGTLRPYFNISPKLDFSITYDLWYETLVSGIQPKEISVILFGFHYSNF